MTVTDKQAREGWSTMNLPPDCREGLNEVKKHIKVMVGINATDADAVRHLLLMRQNKLALFEARRKKVRE